MRTLAAAVRSAMRTVPRKLNQSQSATNEVYPTSPEDTTALHRL